MNLPAWATSWPKWDSKPLALLLETTPEPILDLTCPDLIEKSDQFPIKFPTENVRAKFLQSYISREKIAQYINSTYPIVHEAVLELYAKFLLLKREQGSKYEKEFYGKMSLLNFVDRLLQKRAVVFMGRTDYSVLLTGEEERGRWDTIGTDLERAPFTLENCLSYEEIKLSVFLSVSGFTYFLNDGSRHNNADFWHETEGLEPEGVIIGLVGCRFERALKMEYEEIVITPQQNVVKNGYGSKEVDSVKMLLGELYEEPLLLHGQVNDKLNRYTRLTTTIVFDDLMYSKRLSFSIDTLLGEANQRAKQQKTSAFVHVVGLGLGAWQISPHQGSVFMETFAQRLKVLDGSIDHISDLCFSYINVPTCGTYSNGQLFKLNKHPNNGINIHILKRDPHIKLVSPNDGKLPIISYAWDGNALPGNEFWKGLLDSSGDPAAASSTQIAELHNAHINPKVQAANLRIVTKSQGVVSIFDYQDNIRCQSLQQQ